MSKPLRVLLIEDDEQDALLVTRELKRGGYELTLERVDTPEAMAAALGQPWDIVISDYRMPRFSAPAAFALLKARGLDTPFIIVSGTVGEEVAVEAMRSGVNDYLLKGKLARLCPAVERELREAGLRSDQRHMRDQLLLADRLASVGTLAAGVAHEINNPLASLIANLEFATKDLKLLVRDAVTAPPVEGELATWLAGRLGETDETLRHARDSAERVRVIVRDLKIFSRTDGEESRPVELQAVLESSIRIAWNEIRHRARLVRDFRDVPAVNGNEGRLGQVFLNLLVNAAQAIPEGRADDHEIRVVTRAHGGERVSVEVHDTGAGMPPEVMARIFDPFFTTKPIGVGTGLGLAVCQRIVMGLGGRILVDSRVGKGTTFCVELPAVKQAAARRDEATLGTVTTPLVAVAGRRGRVLVVDDEVLITKMVRRMLSAEHDVVPAPGGHEALQKIVAGERFDLILCDLMMPEMTGMELHDEIARVAPEQVQRMVFMTGGAFTPRAREFLDTVSHLRIEKPFETDGLRALVNKLIG